MKRILLALLIIISIFLCACRNDSENTQVQVDYDELFAEFANSNPYDLEYDRILRNDESTIGEAMAKLLTDWNDELEYTIAAAEPLIGEDYGSWKNNMLSNFDSINGMYKVQYDRAISEHIAQLQFFEIKIRHVQAVRELTLNAKYFCFILEEERGTAQKDMISLSWNRK